MLDMGAVVATRPVKRMLHEQGFAPGRDLGRYLTGDPQPVSYGDLVVQPLQMGQNWEVCHGVTAKLFPILCG